MCFASGVLCSPFALHPLKKIESDPDELTASS